MLNFCFLSSSWLISKIVVARYLVAQSHESCEREREGIRQQHLCQAERRKSSPTPLGLSCNRALRSDSLHRFSSECLQKRRCVALSQPVLWNDPLLSCRWAFAKAFDERGFFRQPPKFSWGLV
jgi:hypothetical protein